MIELMTGLPDNVIGFTAKGKITHEDYALVIIPEIESRLARHPKIRVLYHLGAEFSRFEAGALWDDAKIGLRHPRSWERVAVVTDVEWLRSACKMLGFIIPGEVRVFANAALADAQSWVTE